MEDPRLRRIRQRPERPLLDWTRIREAAEHSWYLIQKPWPGAAIDTTLDWERAKLLWVTRNVDPHAWSPLRTMAHAALAAHSVETSAAVVGAVAGSALAMRWRHRRRPLAVGCLGLIGLRYCVLVPFLAANVYADKTWHPALEDSAHVFTPWRREHRRGVDQSARLSLLPAHLLSSAAAPAAVVLGAAYVLTSPVAARSSLLRRVATIRVLERRAADVLRRQAGAAREEAPALTADEAQAVARMRIAGGIGDAPRWVVTDFGHPRLGDAGAPMGERVDAQCERSRN